MGSVYTGPDQEQAILKKDRKSGHEKVTIFQEHENTLISIRLKKTNYSKENQFED